MDKFSKNLFAVLGMVIILIVVGMLVPSIREAIWAVLIFFWQLIKAFFLESIVGKLFIMIAILLIGGSLCWSQKEQRKLFAALTMLFELITGILFFAA